MVDHMTKHVTLILIKIVDLVLHLLVIFCFVEKDMMLFIVFKQLLDCLSALKGDPREGSSIDCS